MYDDTVLKVKSDIARCKAYALTTDTWTSIVSDNYMTVTLHILADWKMTSYVLSTKCSNERHTAANLKELLESVIDQWDLKRDDIDSTIVVTTDNAANIVLAVESSDYSLRQVGCFAHTLNLAVQKGTSTRSVSNIIATTKRIVSFFHRSTSAKGILTIKQKQLDKPVHCLVNDVSTRWNSTLSMLERFAEQRAAIYAALDELGRNDLFQSISRISTCDVESIIAFLQPFKTATEVMSGESYCTISLIKPLQNNLLAKCKADAADSKLIEEMKAAVSEDLAKRYTDPDTCEFLNQCALLDPRFKHVSLTGNENTEAETEHLYSVLRNNLIELQQPDVAAAPPGSPAAQNEDGCEITNSPIRKKSALESLFGEDYSQHHTQRDGQQTLRTRVSKEVGIIFRHLLTTK